MITSESIRVDASDAELIYVHLDQMRASGVNMGGPLWFARANLPWVLKTLRECLDTYGFPGVEEQRGDDFLCIYEAGPEQAPFVHFQNERRKDSSHGGVYSLPLSKPMAEKLYAQLSAL